MLLHYLLMKRFSVIIIWKGNLQERPFGSVWAIAIYTYFERIGDVGKGLTIIKMMMMMTVMMIARKIFPGFLFICEDMS